MTGKPAAEYAESLPSRGVWIEIDDRQRIFYLLRVAPLAGSVD